MAYKIWVMGKGHRARSGVLGDEYGRPVGILVGCFNDTKDFIIRVLGRGREGILLVLSYVVLYLLCKSCYIYSMAHT
jgi:hypothetical protein